MANLMNVMFKNEKAFKRSIARKVKALSDMREPISKALDYMEVAIKEKTAKQQNETIKAGSRPFKKLDVKYAAAKNKKWGFKPILFASGKMVTGNWYQKILQPLYGILKYTASPKQTLIAMSHQVPKKFPKRRRRWFGFRGGDRQRVAMIIKLGIKKAVRA